MRVHFRTHNTSRQRTFVCDFPNCGRGFYDRQHLKQHHIIHTRSPQSYVCPHLDCGKKYDTSAGLKLHIKSHHEVYIYIYYIKNRLKRNMYVIFLIVIKRLLDKLI